MSRKPARPPLGGLTAAVIDDGDNDRIREYGLSRGFLPTDPPAPAPAAAPAPAPPAPSPAPAQLFRPAATRPWQAMFPDYLIDDLRQAAAREGTAQKVIVLKALRQAGFRVDDIDLQDLRRR